MHSTKDKIHSKTNLRAFNVTKLVVRKKHKETETGGAVCKFFGCGNFAFFESKENFQKKTCFCKLCLGKVWLVEHF